MLKWMFYVRLKTFVFLLKMFIFKKLAKDNSMNFLLPTFSFFWQNNYLLTLFKTLISQKVCHFEQQNKNHIFRIKELEFIQFTC